MESWGGAFAPLFRAGRISPTRPMRNLSFARRFAGMPWAEVTAVARRVEDKETPDKKAP